MEISTASWPWFSPWPVRAFFRQLRCQEHVAGAVHGFGKGAVFLFVSGLREEDIKGDDRGAALPEDLRQLAVPGALPRRELPPLGEALLIDRDQDHIRPRPAGTAAHEAPVQRQQLQAHQERAGVVQKEDEPGEEHTHDQDPAVLRRAEEPCHDRRHGSCRAPDLPSQARKPVAGRQVGVDRHGS